MYLRGALDGGEAADAASLGGHPMPVNGEYATGAQAAHMGGAYPVGWEGGGSDGSGPSPSSALRPRHLAASLTSRVLPRLAFCKARERQPSLSGVSTMTDAAFCKQIGEEPSGYATFLKAWQRERESPALEISWLPEGLDLEALLGGDQGS